MAWVSTLADSILAMTLQFTQWLLTWKKVSRLISESCELKSKFTYRSMEYQQMGVGKQELYLPLIYLQYIFNWQNIIYMCVYLCIINIKCDCKSITRNCFDILIYGSTSSVTSSSSEFISFALLSPLVWEISGILSHSISRVNEVALSIIFCIRLMGMFSTLSSRGVRSVGVSFGSRSELFFFQIMLSSSSPKVDEQC